MSRELGGGLVHSLFEKIISVENLFRAWKKFSKGKKKKLEVAIFEFNLEDNLFKLHNDLLSGKYKPDPYVAFYVRDPKLRHIHKASVRDRVFHQALFSILYDIFDEGFIFDSYSSRKEKGTHSGNNRLEKFIYKATHNWTECSYVLKCDVRKFFDSINHKILFSLMEKKIADEKTLRLVKIVLQSFEKTREKGLPLGNVTSQLFANVYMNEFDQFVKHLLKVKWYARYCDDFVIVRRNKIELVNYIPRIRQFLTDKLLLDLHPNKISLRKARQGVDFLGYVVLPHRKVLRTKTKIRIFRKITEKNLSSYMGILSHCKGKRLENTLDSQTHKTYSSDKDQNGFDPVLHSKGKFYAKKRKYRYGKKPLNVCSI